MKERSILKSTRIVVITLLCVKIIGFVKQAVIAAYYGTTGSIDKFLLVSELMENLGTAIFSAIAISFLTIYVETKLEKGQKGVELLTSNIFVACLPIILIFVFLLICFSEQIAVDRSSWIYWNW